MLFWVKHVQTISVPKMSDFRQMCGLDINFSHRGPHKAHSSQERLFDLFCVKNTFEIITRIPKTNRKTRHPQHDVYGEQKRRNWPRYILLAM